MTGERTPRRKLKSRRGNGNGSIYQRSDGRWVARVYLLMPDGSAGRRDFYGDTEADARRKMVAAQARSDQGIPAEATGWTVGAFLAYWLEYVVKPARKPKTFQGYEVVVRVHLVPGLGRKRLNRLSGADVRAFLRRFEGSCLCCLHGYDQRRDERTRRCCGVGRCCRSVPSRRLVQQVHAVLRNALQAAVREELIGRNVAKLVQVAGPEYDTNRGLSVEQARKLLVAARADRLHALYVLALYLGLRRGELLGLRWVDVDLDRAVLHVRRSLQRVGGELRLVPPKSRRSKRTVPLPGVCVEALRDHRDAQDRERVAAGEDWRDSGQVFTTSIGTPIEPDNLRRSWYPLREQAGLGGAVLHGLRHTCVTLLLNLGVPPHIVRDIVGHSDIDVTMTIYAEVSLDDKRDALRRLDEHLG